MNKTNSGVIETAKDKSVAVIKGTEKVAETTVDSTGRILSTAVKDTARVGGEVGTAATGLVTGAIKDVEKAGVGSEHAAAAVAGGAVKAVGQVGTAALGTIHKPAALPTGSHKAGPKPHVTSASRN